MKVKKITLIFFLILILAFTLCSCSLFSDDTTVIDPDGTGSVSRNDINILVPETPGTVTYSGNGVTIDASNVKDGYIAVKSESKQNRLKTQIILNEHSYNYDLESDNNYEIFPLQMGNGTYKVRVLENIGGTSYSPIYQADVEVRMDDTDRVFVFPSQYVWYTNEALAVSKSFELCKGLSSDDDKVDKLYEWVVDYLTYDKELAASVEDGYIPDLENTMKTKKGICFDYAALFGAMLRAQGIPTRLVIGKVEPEGITHCWNQVYVNGTWKWMDPTMEGKGHKESDYIKEREY